jgi:HSP20 family protein
MPNSILFHRAQKSTKPIARANVYDGGNHYLLQVDAVGFTKEDIQLSATSNTLNILAETENEIPEGYSPLYNSHEKEQQIQRSFRFRDAIDTDSVEAHISNGLLTITVPKRAAQKIEITVL